MHQTALERQSVLSSIEDVVQAKHDSLKPVNSSWQPADFLPDMVQEDWHTHVMELQRAARQLPDELIVVLVGSTVTEEALPSYQACLTRTEDIGNKTGVSENPWARWSRSWTAEENRHGDLLNRYLYLTGRVNMRSVERTIQHLVRNGFDPGHENNPYHLLVYTSFQEQATRISHANVGQLAKRAGDSTLWKICSAIAGDEARHEDAYKTFMNRVFELDPAGGILAFDEMLAKKLKMPATLMSDGSNDDVFSLFVGVAQNLEVYTFTDYASIVEQLIKLWNVPGLKGLQGTAAEAQERICRLPELYRRRINWLASKPVQRQQPPYPWINASATQTS